MDIANNPPCVDTRLMYQYTTIKPDEVRLLKLQGASDSIECELHIFQRNNAPIYNALSYCWGSDQRTEAVSCNGEDILITGNLRVVLDQLSQPRWHSPDYRTWFWIDAICINQFDDAEKASQVAAMGGTYSNAAKVLVSLGATADDSDLAMDSLPSIAACMSMAAVAFADAGLPIAKLPDETDPVWDAIFALFNRPYFERGWVLQEVVLAKTIEVLCGDKIISWDVLTTYAEDYWNAIPWTTVVKDPAYNGRNSRTGRAGCSLLQKLRKDATHGYLNTNGCFSLLWISAAKDFSDHRDRIFALGGLLPPELRGHLRVDYNSDDAQVAVAFGKLLLPYIPSLLLLSLKQSSSVDSALPSWCPAFHEKITSFNTLAHFDGWRANTNISGSRSVPDIHINAESAIVGIRGFIVDTVKSVAPIKLPPVFDINSRRMHPEFPVGFLCWEGLCRDILGEAHPDGLTTDLLEAYARTLAAGHLNMDDPIPPDHNMLEDLQAALRQFTIIVAEAMPHGYDPLKETGSLSRFVGAVEGQHSRKFFTTQDGRMGMGPEDLLPGDKVCVLYSGQPLYVLRYDEKTETDTYVGEAYLHDCMDLDTMSEDAWGKDEMFWIG